MMNHDETTARDLIESGSARLHISTQRRRVLFWTADTRGSCETVSTNWSEYTAQPLDAATGDGWLSVVVPEDRAQVTDAVRWAIGAQRGFYLRYRIRCADGSVRRVLHEAGIRTLPSGRFNGLVGTLIDESDDQPEENSQLVFRFLDRIPLPAVAVDPRGRLAHVNAPMLDVLAGSAGELLGGDWIGRFVSGEDRARVNRLFSGDAPLSALPHEIEYLVDTPQGQRLFRWHLTLIRDAAGQPFSVAMMGTDISKWRHADDHQRLTAHMFSSSKEAMVITDRNNDIISVNPAFTTLTGYRREEAIGRNPRLLQSGKHDRAFYQAMWKSILENGYWRGDVWDRRKDGSMYPKFLSITAMRDEEGKIANFSAIFYDVSERKRLEDELENLAHFDPLTRLPNRMLLHDRLEKAIALTDRQQQHLALLFIDLDDFKPVNDTFGHTFGDEVLKMVGQRLGASIRGIDTAARLGGDEFVVILNDIGQRDNAASVAHKIVAALSEPYTIAGETVRLSASIGISLYPDDDLPADELLRTADEAMYKAKRENSPRVIFHHDATGGDA